MQKEVRRRCRGPHASPSCPIARDESIACIKTARFMSSKRIRARWLVRQGFFLQGRNHLSPSPLLCPLPPSSLPYLPFSISRALYVPLRVLPWVVPPADVEAAESNAEIVERHPKRVVLVVLHQPQAGTSSTRPQHRVVPPIPSPLLR